TEPVVDFKGRYHEIPEAGINPLPVQRPIPIWIGGTAPAALQRAGRLGDGWFPQVQPGEKLDEMKRHVAEGARESGRDLHDLGMEGRISLTAVEPAQWKAATDAWREAGATHTSVNTMGQRPPPASHIGLSRQYREMVG